MIRQQRPVEQGRRLARQGEKGSPVVQARLASITTRLYSRSTWTALHLQGQLERGALQRQVALPINFNHCGMTCQHYRSYSLLRHCLCS
eukprot:4885912-Amphidinium_carterae.1